MNMENKAIVGYVPGIPISDNRQSLIAITNDLKSEPGFIRVIKKIYHLHAVLVEVVPDIIDEFVQSVERKDHIEYCVKDYLLRPNSYQEYIPKQYIKTHKSQNNIKTLHNIKTTKDSGVGSKIALIDTGISPHPYLPAFTFNGCLNFKETWHEINNNIPLLDNSLYNLKKMEEKINQGDPAFDKKYIDVANQEIINLESEAWRTWFSAYSAGHFKTISPPTFGSTSGIIRKLSVNSWNFVDNTNDITDKCGHGTSMAGIISGLSPYSYIEKDQIKKSIIEKYELQVLGISPFSELLILKCYDDSQKLESSFLKMLDALEYCSNLDLDVVYVGIGFSGALNPKSIIPLSRKIEKLKSLGIPVICPAGNVDKDSGDIDLEFPAADEFSLAITSINSDSQSIPSPNRW